jgi:hypothetical protein
MAQGKKMTDERFVAFHKLSARHPSDCGVSLFATKLAISQTGKTSHEYREASCNRQMNHPAKAVKAKASISGRRRGVFCVIARLVPEILFPGMAQIEKLQGAFEELVDFFFADFLGGKEGVEIEVGKTARGDARGKKLAQAAGIDGA